MFLFLKIVRTVFAILFTGLCIGCCARSVKYAFFTNMNYKTGDGLAVILTLLKRGHLVRSWDRIYRVDGIPYDVVFEGIQRLLRPKL